MNTTNYLLETKHFKEDTNIFTHNREKPSGVDPEWVCGTDKNNTHTIAFSGKNSYFFIYYKFLFLKTEIR